MELMPKLLLWGTGIIAKGILNNGINAEIVGFIETNKSKDMFMGKPVYEIEKIPENYTYILIANSHAEEIYELCLRKKLDLSKCIFLRELKRKVGFFDPKEIKSILGEKNYIDYCCNNGIVEESFLYDDIKKYNELNTKSNFQIQEKYIWPIITDKYAKAGTIGNYFMQDLWAAKLIYRKGVKKHFDIGSRIDGFIAHLLAMDIEVSVIDIREFPEEVENLHTIVDDATTLSQIMDNSIESMSALCSLEHFGLGRYGDPINPEACFDCFNNIQKKIAEGGNLYISLPIGKERVEFNAHRVFYASTIVESFSSLQLKEFSCTAEGKIEYNVDIHKYDNDEHYGDYRYGLFHFVK